MSAAPFAGAKLGEDIELVERIGAGGMGAVWLARNEALRADVVVKFLLPEHRDDPGLRARLVREARAAARIASPHVVRVFDVKEESAFGPYLVMEKLAGLSLAARVDDEEKLGIADASRITHEMLDALGEAHRHGITHRDVKPSNVFLCTAARGSFVTKVLDFGVARVEGETMTEVGVVVGTPSYMSPEQLGASEVDGRSDLYAVALVFYRVVTGTNAVPLAALRSLGVAALRMPLPSPRLREPALPAGVDGWFAKATAFDREDRFASAAEMAAALDEALGDIVESAPSGPKVAAEGTTEVATPAPLPEPSATEAAKSERSVRRSSVGVVAFAAVGFFAVGAFALRAIERPAPSPPPPVPPAVATDASCEIVVPFLVDTESQDRERGRILVGAARVAEELVAEHGGVRGCAFRVRVVEDGGARDASLRTPFAAWTNAATTPLLLGPVQSDQWVTLAPWLDGRTHVVLSPSVTTDPRPPSDTPLLRVSPDDRAAVAALASAMTRKDEACTSAAIVASDDTYGRVYRDRLATALTDRKVRVTLVPLVSPLPARNYRETLHSVDSAKATCEVLVVPATVGARYLLEAPRTRTIRTFAADSLANDDFVALARGDRRDTTARSAAEGVVGVRRSTEIDGPAFRFFERRWGARVGTPRATFAAASFDATMLAALALARVGPNATAGALRTAVVAISREGPAYGPQDVDEIFRALRAGREASYQGASGDVDLQDDASVTARFALWRVRDGGLVETPLAP